MSDYKMFFMLLNRINTRRISLVLLAVINFLGASTRSCLGLKINALSATTIVNSARTSTITSTDCRGTKTATSLHMMTAPTFIITPIIKKWQEERKKKDLPLASQEERAGEAPGLRVGAGAWKWPPLWPYDDKFFRPLGDESAPDAGMSTLLNGMAGGSLAPALPPSDKELKKLDVVAYWVEEKKDLATEIDADSAEAIRRHYSFYLEDGMDILEFGAAEESYLPENFKPNRHVGVGLSPTLMDRNPSITEKKIINLNKVIIDVGIDSEDLENLGSDSFDAIIMANTIDFLTDPKEVFRSAWKLLKPGGIMIVPFLNKDAYVDKFEQAQTKMWRDFKDDQHLWVCGSFFHFSAAEGWDGLNGFDLSSEDSEKKKKEELPLIGGLLDQNKSGNAYVVQARKSSVSESIDENDPEKSFRSLMWILPTMEERDKTLVALRLGRAYALSKSEDKRRKMTENVKLLPKIYESLIAMDQFQFPFNLQSQLAVNVASDPDFIANEEQLQALKMGLGLSRPSKSFWEPVGQLTASMEPEDKVNLLAYIVPRFGSNSHEQEMALEAFVSGLKPTFKVIRSKCPDMSEGDVQLLGSELLAVEILIPGRSNRSEFARWLQAMTKKDLEEYLIKRKSSKEAAMSEMKQMQKERDAAEEKRKEELKRFNEQVEKARKERTVIFNEMTGKMLYVEKKQ